MAQSNDGLFHLPMNQNHAQPQTGQLASSPDFRKKAIELLSNVANGCLSELGYYPGLLDDLARARADNAKMYADNRVLAQQIAFQTDRISFLTGNEGERLRQFDELKRMVRGLLDERSGQQQQCEHYKAALEKLQAQYDTLRKSAAHTEDKFLRLYQLALKAGVIPGPRSQQQPPATTRTHTAHQPAPSTNQSHIQTTRVPPASTGQRHIQTIRIPPASQQHAQPLPIPPAPTSRQHVQPVHMHPNLVADSSASSSMTSRPATQAHQNKPFVFMTDTLRQQQQQTGSGTAKPSRRVSYPSANVGASNHSRQSESQSAARPAQGAQNMAPPATNLPRRPQSASASAVTVNTQARPNSAAAALPTSHNHQAANLPPHFNRLLTPLSVETFKLPDFKRAKEPAPSGVVPPRAPAAASQPVIDLTSDDDESRPRKKMATQKLQQQPTSVLEGAAPPSPASSSDIPLSAIHPRNASGDLRRQPPPPSASTSTLKEAAPPSPTTSSDTPLSMSAIYSHRGSALLPDRPEHPPPPGATASTGLVFSNDGTSTLPIAKRARTLSHEPELVLSPKRARVADPAIAVDNPDADNDMNGSREPDPVMSPQQARVEDPPATADNPDADMNGMDIEPPISALPGASFGRLTEDEEEVLTSEEECATTIFDEDDDRPGEHSCTLCRLRFEDGLADTPETYVNPSMDVLIAHCKEEHPTVWDSLRHTRPSESPPESPAPS